MKTNHSQTAAFLVFSWMIFLSFFNNREIEKPRKDYQPVRTIIIPTKVDSSQQNLTYQPSLTTYNDKRDPLND